MRQTYHKPTFRHCLVSSSQLLSNSIQVNDTDKVSNSEDIGFTKKDDGSRYNVWNDDWRE